MKRTTYRTQTDDRFTYKTRLGSGEWTVSDVDTLLILGYARQNGSRLRERSWTWRTPAGLEGKTGSRRWAAEALARTTAEAGR